MDTVFVPFHWGGEGCANLLTSTYTDPVSHIPEFKVCAVRADRAEAADDAAPAGAATAQFSHSFIWLGAPWKPHRDSSTASTRSPELGSRRGAARCRDWPTPSLRQAVAADLLPRRQFGRWLVAVSLMKDGKVFRIFPIGAKAAVHVPLAVVEDLFPESKVECSSPPRKGVGGHVVLDIGLIEI